MTIHKNTAKKKDKDLLETDVQWIKGVGPRRKTLLEQMHIFTVSDLLNTIPNRYEDRQDHAAIGEIAEAVPVSVSGNILAAGWVTPRYGKGYFEIRVSDDTGVLACRWFGAHFLKDVMLVGAHITLHGKVSKHKGHWVMIQGEYELGEDEDAEDSVHLSRIVPVYPLTESLGQKNMRTILYNAVQKYCEHIKETLPDEIRIRRKLIGAAEAYRQVHFPDSLEMAAAARTRLVFEEFLVAQMLVLKRRASVKAKAGFALKAAGPLPKAYVDSLPFSLTSGQKEVLKEIVADMASGLPMNRLLQGDVGSGKTVVAALAICQAIDSGVQCAIMVPTEVLAVQHFKNLAPFFTASGIESAILTGDTSAADRKNAYAGFKSGRIKLVIGTHALFYDKVEFKRLGLVIIDEQHKFGVVQRASLYEKGTRPHVLVMTATPIPRTLSMTVYGDLDVSIIKELPAGRQEIVTRVIEEDKLQDAYGFISKQVAKGRQAYMVYPLVSESEKLDLHAAETMYHRLKDSWFKNERVGLIHGRMKSEEKNNIMEQFKSHKIDILVATTVIEVGVDVPNANLMLIGNAERFGLSQLHQLRGRVGRGTYKSFCILQGEARGLDSWRRLKIMEETTDGFIIAEEDLRIRGMGNILGKEQSGFSAIKLGDPMKDNDILIEARSEATRICEIDPFGEHPDFKPLWKRVEALADQVGSLVQVG